MRLVAWVRKRDADDALARSWNSPHLIKCVRKYLRIDDLLGVHGRFELAVFREKLYRIVENRSIAAVLRPGAHNLDIGLDGRGDDVFGHIRQVFRDHRLEDLGVRMDHAESLQQLGDISDCNVLVLSQPIYIGPKTGAADVEQVTRFDDVITARRLRIEIEPITELDQSRIDLVVL